MSREDPPGGEDLSAPVAPGALSALLRELAAAPEDGPSEDWQVGLMPGQRVGRFELGRELGRGGFGVVYEARDLALGRKVALKAVRTGSRSGMRQERLQQEAEAVALLSHPNLVTLFDLGRCAQGPYLVLELLQGQSLSARLRAGSLPVKEAVRVALEVARGVAHAHARGVIHRDLTPGNVFLCDDGRVKVLDFGLAHAFGHQSVAGGTPSYMAPEQRAGAPEDERTDVFALGVILHRMLSGQLPFPGDDGKALLSPARAPQLEVPALPGLGELVNRMLEKNPVKRPRQGEEVRVALEAIEAGLGGAPEGPPPRVLRRTRPRLRLAWLLALGMLLGAALAALALRTQRAGPGAPGDRMVVAVADIANQTGDPELDALSGLLITALEQSSRLEVVSRSRSLDLLRPASGEALRRIDEPRGREVARRTGARALALGALYRFGERYVVELRAVEPATDRLLASVKEQGLGKENLPDLLDRVSERLRLALGEEPGSIRATSIQLARAVTPSVEAWAHYVRGLDCFEGAAFAASYQACLVELGQAVAIDPEFALGHLMLSQLSFVQGLPRAMQKSALAPALARADRLPPRDRLRVHGWNAFLEGQDESAKALLGRAAAEARDDKLAWWLAGEIPFHRDEFAEAVPFFRQVHALDPTWIEPIQHLVFALGALGDAEGIRALVQDLAGQPSPQAAAVRCYALLWVDPSSAVPICEAAVAAGAGELGDQFLALALLQQGRRGPLRAHLGRMARGKALNTFGPFMALLLRAQEGRWPEVIAEAEGSSALDDSWFHSGYAEAVLGSGERDRAWREALRVLELDRSLVPNLAVHFAYVGDLAHAEELAAFLPRGSPRAGVYAAVVRWRRGDLAGAVEQLRPLAARGALSSDPPLPAPLYLLGEALSEQGRDAEAAEALERFRAMPLTYPSWLYPRCLYHLARSWERLGELGASRAAVAELLNLWKNASPGQPLLAEARALGARLGIH